MTAPTKEARRRWRENNRDRKNATDRAWQRKRRDKVMVKLGGSCVKCGNDDIRVLTLDHINGGGNRHRLTITYNLMYRQLLDGSYDGPELQILCANCHAIKSYNREEI